MSKKRDLFGEIMEGFDALEGQRAGKRTLRTQAVKARPAPRISARELGKIRKDPCAYQRSKRLGYRSL